MIFTLIYWGAGGLDPNGNTGIYPGLLDWALPVTTIITISASCGAVVVSQIILWGIYRCKMALLRRCSRQTGTDLPQEGSVYNDENANLDDEQDDEAEKANFYENLAFNVVENGMPMPSLSTNQNI